jgi:hypothetical protein
MYCPLPTSANPLFSVNPVYYNETVTVVGATSLGAFSCTGYPQVAFWYKRGGVQAQLVLVTMSAVGSSRTAAPIVTALQPGDVVTANISTLENTCTDTTPA